MKSTKKSFIMSLLSLVLCFAMLIGTTYAWFTDSVTSGKNKIVAGNLDVEMYHWNKNVGSEANPKTVADATDLFETDLWEPGKVVYENFKVANVGTLALTYQFAMNVFDYNTVTRDDGEHALSEILKVIILDGESFSGTREDAIAKFTAAGDSAKTIADFNDKGCLMPKGKSGTLYNEAVTDSKTFAVLIYWEPSDSDNVYNVNNNATVNTSVKGISATAANNALFVELGINLVATQIPYEKDSFDEKYDASANFPVIDSASVKVPVSNKTAVVELPVAPEPDSTTKVTLTELNESVTTVKLDEEIHDVLASNKSYAINAQNAAAATIDLNLYINDQSATTSEGFKAKVETYVAKNMKGVTINYKGDSSKAFGSSGTATLKSTEAEVTNVGDYFYHPASGRLVFLTDHFSEYVVGTTSEAYIGSYYQKDSSGKLVTIEKRTAYNTVADALAAIDTFGVPSYKNVAIIILKDCTYKATKVIEFNIDISYNHTLTVDDNEGKYDVAIDKTSPTNYIYSITEKKEYACKNGDTYYESLTDALMDDARNNNCTITILRNITCDSMTNPPTNEDAAPSYGDHGSNITIDLNGFTVTGVWTLDIYETNLTITDSSAGKTGRIHNISFSSYAGDHTLTFDGVTLNAPSGKHIVEGWNKSNIVVKNSTITIENGGYFVTETAQDNPTLSVSLESGSLTINEGGTGFANAGNGKTFAGSVTKTTGFTVTGSGTVCDKEGFTITEK